jgi:hypothetical protein
MQNIYISHNSLPKISETSKKLINQGSWFLYKISGSEAKYMLKINGTVWLLNEDGSILNCLSQKPEDISVDESIYFEGVSAPQSLSNYAFV